MAIDPVGVKKENTHSFNRYAYANNNPYRYVDPNGESVFALAFLAMDVGTLLYHVGTGNSAGALSSLADVGLSVVGVISPLPGIGQALKAANKTREIARVAKSGVQANKAAA